MMRSTASSGSAQTGTTSEGIPEAFLRYVGSLSRHLTALAGLAQVEAREAAENYLKIAVFLILGLVFGIFGYVFFLLFVAFLIGGWFGISWVWISLVLAGLHLFLAGVCAWNIREGLRKPVFPMIATEIRRDFTQLSGQNPASPPATPPYA